MGNFSSAVLSVLSMALTQSSALAQCGKEGQRPCTVLERIPSCAQGLVEDFGLNKCVRPRSTPNCGKEGQRPCKVTERIPSCDRGIVEDFAMNKCVKPQTVSQADLERAKEILDKHVAQLNVLKGVTRELSAVAKQLHSSGQFRNLLNAGKYAEIGELLNINLLRQRINALQIGDNSASSPRLVTDSDSNVERKFIVRSVSIGEAADASVIGGAAGEHGIVFSVGDAVRNHGIWGYRTFGYRAGIAVGVSAGVAVTLWSLEANELCGNGQGLSFGAGTPYGGFVFALWRPPFEEWPLFTKSGRMELPLYGVSFIPEMGVEVEVSTTRTVTIVQEGLGFGKRSCSDCGTRGHRPCTVFERMPSCDQGLVEKWGRCLKSSDQGLPESH